MPHQCTNCDRTFADGSKQMLSGCPECGGNRFQFIPEGTERSSTVAGRGGAAGSSSDIEDGEESATEPTPTTRPRRSASSALTEAQPVGPDTDRKGPTMDSASGISPESDIIEAPAEPVEDDREDRAQASARRSLVTDEELPAADRPDGAQPSDDPPDEAERPDIAQLRQELNEQFESIKICRPGEYELNLMELYDRDEYIIALEEDGRYVIDVPDSWNTDE